MLLELEHCRMKTAHRKQAATAATAAEHSRTQSSTRFSKATESINTIEWRRGKIEEGKTELVQ